MDTAKPALRYKISNYEISVNLFSAKCFSASIIDHELKCEYNEPNIELKRISANTVMKAFEKSQK